jgi:hypothetical protein
MKMDHLEIKRSGLIALGKPFERHFLTTADPLGCSVNHSLADLSGRMDGWISSKSIGWFREMLYWPEAHRKILFGSNVHCTEIETTLTRRKGIFEKLSWCSEQIGMVMNNNARDIFGFWDTV